MAAAPQIPDYQQGILSAWQKFTANQELDPLVPPLIAASWRRCWGRVNPDRAVEFTRMSSDHLLASQTASFDLIAVARPVMEDVYQCIQQSGSGIILTNSAGCVLDMLGDESILKTAADWGAGLGTILTEEQIGTTSIGLALAERMPVQVVGHEHFVRQFHVVTGAAAPMFDISGRLLGVLGMVMPRERYHIHSLGLVAAAARAIESQRQSDFLLAEQNSQLAQLNAILSAISDGILVWNSDHVLVHANRAASQILGVPARSMMGKPAASLFTVPTFVSKAVLRQKPLTDVDGIINVGERKIRCLISVDFVFNRPDEPEWIIVTLRPEEKVRKLVQRQVGADAALTLADIPGSSPHMHRVRRFVQSAAGAQASVLIRGEEGTGKNALASAIHNAGPRQDGPFVIFACSSIPNELVVSELLGFEEGSGRRPEQGRPSKFELAEGGTLFFQDVDALPLEAQAVLLNALELGMIQRLGNGRPVEVDARIIASTRASMETLIAHGSFRPDLYHRLNLFSVTLPPLRERPHDIPQVVDRILARFTRQFGYQVSLSAQALDILVKYPWPGNIREVEAVLGRAATQIAGPGIIGMAQLPAHVRRMDALPQHIEPFLQVSSLSEMERDAIFLTVQTQRGNVSRIARVLGVSRTTLWRKLKIYGIDPAEFRRRN